MKVYRFKCKDCGSTSYEKVDKHTYKCSYCGYREEVHREEEKVEEKPQVNVNVEYIPTETRENNRDVTHLIILLIACILGGSVGIHKFIERKFISGIIYLFTFGLFGIGVFFDIVGIVIKLACVQKNHNYVSYHESSRERDYND